MSPYSYRPSSPFGGPGFLNSAVGRLILINAAVFFLTYLVPGFTGLFALTPRLVLERGFVWQLVTYQFLHAGFGHIFFNMLALFFFGNMVESVWGARRFLRYYLICGIGAGLLNMAIDQRATVVGASGSIYGVLLATAMMFPDAYVYLYFMIPVRVKYFVAGLAILDLAHGVSGRSGVAYFAHLGGLITGLFFFRHEILRRWNFSRGPQRQWKAYVAEEQRKEEKRHHEENNIDSILDKISAKGYDNLTPTEKRILENYSRQKDNDSSN